MSLSFDLSPVISYRFPHVQQQTRAMLIQLKNVSKSRDATRGNLYAAMAKSPDFASGVANQQVSSKTKLVFVISNVEATTIDTGAIDVKWGGTYFRIHLEINRKGAYGWLPKSVEPVSRGQLFVQEGQPANVPVPINNNAAAAQIPLQANAAPRVNGANGDGESPYGTRIPAPNSLPTTDHYANLDRNAFNYANLDRNAL